MSQIQVQAPGLLTTVQDLGREGFGLMGVSASGAADPIALRLGNRLVGNADGTAGLEMTLLGGTFLLPQGAVVALAGSDFTANLDGVPVELWTSVKISPGQKLSLGHTRSGSRCYLCVQGGVAVDPSKAIPQAKSMEEYAKLNPGMSGAATVSGGKGAAKKAAAIDAKK